MSEGRERRKKGAKIMWKAKRRKSIEILNLIDCFDSLSSIHSTRKPFRWVIWFQNIIFESGMREISFLLRRHRSIMCVLHAHALGRCERRKKLVIRALWVNSHCAHIYTTCRANSEDFFECVWLHEKPTKKMSSREKTMKRNETFFRHPLVANRQMNLT